MKRPIRTSKKAVREERAKRAAASRARRRKVTLEMIVLVADVTKALDRMTGKVKRLEFLFSLLQEEARKLSFDLKVNVEFIRHRDNQLAELALKIPGITVPGPRTVPNVNFMLEPLEALRLRRAA